MSPRGAAEPLWRSAEQDAVRDKLDETERGTTGMRLVVIASGFVLYPLVQGEIGDIPWLAWSVLVFAALYGGATWRWREVRERLELESAVATSVLDAGFTMVWLYATGGFDSPFFFAIYIAVISISIKFTARETFLGAAIYCAAYLGLAAVSGALHPERLGDLAIRSVYLFLTAGTGALISSQLLSMATARMEARRAAEAERLKERLHAAERLAALGTLAGGVGHEINNPLTWVTNNIKFVRDELGPDADTSIREALDDALDGTSRIASIVRDLKLFSQTRAQRKAVDVPALLRTVLKMAGTEIQHRARLRTDLRPVATVVADEAHLGQVFLNLVVNATHAMDAGRAETNELRVCTRPGSSGSVIIEISDTGMGMSPEVRERIFEPFFTTKDPGKGTGLGLAISHRIVTELGGHIEIDSELGRGTTMRVLLPAADELTASGDLLEPEAKSTSKLRVLVVDDEPLLLRVTTRILSPHAEVETAGDGLQALRRIRGGEVYDVVLCDLVMPEMSGMELHATLAREDPSLAERMLFMAGGAFTDEARAFLEREDIRWLSKPLNPRTLVEALEEQARGGEQRAGAGPAP
ncbi:MAG: response regulator [Myxococcales bacterium]|nr:response regulator [Myxococcales bacterium]